MRAGRGDMQLLGSLARVCILALALLVLVLVVSDWAATGYLHPETAWVVWINPHLRMACFVSLALLFVDLVLVNGRRG
jgi:hypothetical protein